jgi:nicotinamidase-related amidase
MTREQALAAEAEARRICEPAVAEMRATVEEARDAITEAKAAITEARAFNAQVINLVAEAGNADLLRAIQRLDYLKPTTWDAHCVGNA